MRIKLGLNAIKAVFDSLWLFFYTFELKNPCKTGFVIYESRNLEYMRYHPRASRRLDPRKKDRHSWIRVRTGRPIYRVLLPGDIIDAKILIPVVERHESRSGKESIFAAAVRGMEYSETIGTLRANNPGQTTSRDYACEKSPPSAINR
jgi:hypothetical protein